MTRELPTPLLMFIAHRAAEGSIFTALRDAGFTDVTQAQGRLLAGIDPTGTRLTVLADRAGIAKQTATALVDKLEAAGYVQRVPDPGDGRARLVRLTGRAEAMIPVARAEEQRIEGEWAAHLGPRRMRQLREALTQLREITDPYVGQ
ncbi:MarR family transcriptional regulator [Intrasporangium chromatireducens Q5-1]|uniref:MarR family transcriptional regulator n=1 Tax=Intrasporangium chromatireducens Q5-1 TaxID=584657 RepID=W9GN60_9MICO|nr:MarR family transcriptional regulator [Intrasporangium chromatireducens]EWT06497.1 MarR family transcriptional regulator [Intrasporangium chromatireducens Q5-1]